MSRISRNALDNAVVSGHEVSLFRISTVRAAPIREGKAGTRIEQGGAGTHGGPSGRLRVDA
jgi:hypothetical protein